MPTHLVPPWWRPCCSSSRFFSVSMISSQRAERLDLLHLLGAEELLGDRLQPLLGHVDRLLAVVAHHALEDLGEDLVEAVEQPLVLHEGGARQVIERLRRLLDHVAVERLEQHEVLLEAGRNAGGAQFVDEVEQHGDWRSGKFAKFLRVIADEPDPYPTAPL